MPKIRLFISSVQVEFASERQALHDYILADTLLGRFFEPFLFEPLPTLEDIDEDKVRDFVRVARAKRGFRLQEGAAIQNIFTPLNLIVGDRVTHVALLLFGKVPQQFFISSEVRCAHFHGTIVEKPIPSYKVFKGDVFELVDQAEDFVLSKLDYSVGTRKEGASIPGKYEIPREIILEAIVNAIAHRDYT